jgi:hypothetical protein
MRLRALLLRDRKYFFFNVQQLKDRILQLDGQATVTGKNKDALFDLVVKCERKRIGCNTTLNNNQDPYDNDDDDDEEEDTVDPVLLDIFKAGGSTVVSLAFLRR